MRMKRFILIIAVVCIASLSIFFLTGCPTATTTGTTTTTYYIKFKLDGVDKNFDKGYTNYESNPFGNENGSSATALIATPDVETGDLQPNTFILIYFDGVDTDTYPVTLPNGDLLLSLRLDGGTVVWNENITLQVTTYGAVGGTIEGTFSGLLDDGSTITEGEFRVVRAPDDTFSL
jgi:predicted small secreted protein